MCFYPHFSKQCPHVSLTNCKSQILMTVSIFSKLNAIVSVDYWCIILHGSGWWAGTGSNSPKGACILCLVYFRVWLLSWVDFILYLLSVQMMSIILSSFYSHCITLRFSLHVSFCSSEGDVRRLSELSGVFPWQWLCALPRATLPVPAEGWDVSPRDMSPHLSRGTLRTEREGHQPLHEYVSNQHPTHSLFYALFILCRQDIITVVFE